MVLYRDPERLGDLVGCVSIDGDDKFADASLAAKAIKINCGNRLAASGQ